MIELPFMDNHLFEYFFVLAKTLNYTKAADQLYKTESVLSRQISQLENKLGLRLFDRTKKTVALTPAGDAFLNGLISINKNYAALIDEAKALQSGFSGVIKFAALSGVVLHHRMVKILEGFERDYPNIRIDLRTYNLGELRNMILEHQVDFIYGATEDFSDNPEFSYEVICYAKKSIVVHKNHPLAKRDIGDLSVSEFRNDNFLFSTYQDRAVKAFSDICEGFGFLPKCTLVADESMIILLVEMRRGITLLDEAHMFKGNDELVILPIAALGYTQLGIIHDEKNNKACKTLFYTYVKDMNKNDGAWLGAGS